MNVTFERLMELLSYDGKTGVFHWRKSRQGVKAKYNLRAGTISNVTGYVQISIDRKVYLAHRLAWLYVHGRWPVGQIDHINTNRTDNRIHNLREATINQQRHNSNKKRTNTTGFKGVTFQAGKFVAMITHNRKVYYLGRFSTAEAAAEARNKAAKEMHGDFARGN